MSDIFKTYLPLPGRVKAMVVTVPNGDYQIVLNSRLSDTAQQEAFDHEMRHLLHGHFFRPLQPLAKQEKEAADTAAFSKEIPKAEEQGLPLQDSFRLQRGIGDAPPLPFRDKAAPQKKKGGYRSSAATRAGIWARFGLAPPDAAARRCTTAAMTQYAQQEAEWRYDQHAACSRKDSGFGRWLDTGW